MIDKELAEQLTDKLSPIAHNSTEDARGLAYEAIALIRATLDKALDSAIAAVSSAKQNRTDVMNIAPSPAPRGEIDITEAMVDAYMRANDEYWRRTDEFHKNPSRWRQGNPEEATKESLRAALAAAPSPAPRTLTDADYLKLWCDTANIVPTCDHYLHYTRAVEAALSAPAPHLSDKQVQAAIDAWFDSGDEPYDFYNRMRRAIKAALNGVTE